MLGLTAAQGQQPQGLTTQQKLEALLRGAPAQAQQQPVAQDMPLEQQNRNDLDALQLDRLLEQAFAEAKAQNPEITQDQFNDMVEASQKFDFGRLLKISEDAAKAKQEAQASDRDTELSAASTEGASKGETSPDDVVPVDMDDAVERSLAAITSR